MSGCTRFTARHSIDPKFPPLIFGYNFAAPYRACTLLCTLISNYVCWLFLLVLSANAMGCNEKKYGDET